MDEDVAYLLGMIMARGSFIETEEKRRLIIEFPYRNLDTRAPIKSDINYRVPDKIKVCLIDIKPFIDNVLGVDTEIRFVQGAVNFIIDFHKNTMAWRNLRLILSERSNYHEFVLPDSFFDYPEDIIRSFIRGYSDVSAMPSEKDSDPRRKTGVQHRIVLQFSHKNWILPIQICRLLQESLDVPVAHILWGHPSMKRGFREHRMRIFVEDFLGIGFGFEFKQEIPAALAKDSASGDSRNKLCDPGAKRKSPKKEKAPREKHECLPREVRKHFDTTWQICVATGCKQGTPKKRKAKLS